MNKEGCIVKLTMLKMMPGPGIIPSIFINYNSGGKY